ncbi:MAG: hypothetical protein Q9159_001495 [Coniocarpon cinnabarinum]
MINNNEIMDKQKALKQRDALEIQFCTTVDVGIMKGILAMALRLEKGTRFGAGVLMHMSFVPSTTARTLEDGWARVPRQGRRDERGSFEREKQGNLTGEGEKK